MRRARLPRPRGFTLVEVLVALFIMAVMATITWQGIDTMARSRQGAREAIDRTLRVGTVLAQWQADLDAMYLPPTQAQPLLSLRQQSALFVRSAGADGLRVVVWAVRTGRLQRWQGPVVRDLASLQEQWLQAQSLVGNEPAQVTMLEGVTGWETFCRTGGPDLNNCASSREDAPRALQLVIGFADGSTLTREMLVAPHVQRGRS